MKHNENVETLVAQGWPQQQAGVYVRRELENKSRSQTAEEMGISPNTVDNHFTAAKSRVSNAVETVMFLEGEIGGVLDWIEKTIETEHPTQNEISSEEFKQYWQDYPSVPGGK